MARLFWFILLCSSTKVFSQNLFISNKVKYYTGFIKKIFPNHIPKKIYLNSKFDRQGKITEVYEPYFSPSSGPTKFMYDSFGRLIKIINTKTDGSISGVSDFPPSAYKDAEQYYPDQPKAIFWEFEIRNLSQTYPQFNKSETAQIDTIQINKNRKIIQFIKQNDQLIKSAYLTLRKDHLIRYSIITKRSSKPDETHFYRFDRFERLIEEIGQYPNNGYPNGGYFHYKYRYKRDWLLKKQKTSYSKENRVEEIISYKVGYYH